MSIEDKLYPFLGSYNKWPGFLRNFAGKAYRAIPLSMRYGKTYDYYLNLLKKSGYWSEDQKQAYMLEQLQASLKNAYENTDYYAKSFDALGFHPNDVKSLEDIQQLPFTDKMTLRTHKTALMNKNIPENQLMYMTTGGTSGVPVELYYVKGRERSREFVFITDMWKRTGYQFKDRLAILRGKVVDSHGKNDFFKFDPIKNRLYLSTYHLYPENFDRYIEQLKTFRPNYVHTYPSAVSVLAKYIIAEGIELPPLKAVLCSSEQFYPGQRELIEKAFNTRVYSWYGHSEGTTLAGESEHISDYLIYFEYGFTELVDEQGKVITEPGVRGEIVGTSYELTGFPIVRYRTGDFAEYAPGRCPSGRNYTLMTNVKGRWLQETLVTNRDSVISLTALNFHSDLFDRVVQYQFHQREKGKVNLRIVKGPNYTQEDERKIQLQFQEKLQDLITFNIAYVDEIQRTERGKHKFLIQEIPQES